MPLFSDDDRHGLLGAEESEKRTPLPVRMVASEEYFPVPQTAKQRETESRLYALADGIAPRLGLSRRRFFQTSAGMAAAFFSEEQAARLATAYRSICSNYPRLTMLREVFICQTGRSEQSRKPGIRAQLECRMTFQ